MWGMWNTLPRLEFITLLRRLRFPKFVDVLAWSQYEHNIRSPSRINISLSDGNTDTCLNVSPINQRVRRSEGSYPARRTIQIKLWHLINGAELVMDVTTLMPSSYVRIRFMVNYAIKYTVKEDYSAKAPNPLMEVASASLETKPQVKFQDSKKKSNLRRRCFHYLLSFSWGIELVSIPHSPKIVLNKY